MVSFSYWMDRLSALQMSPSHQKTWLEFEVREGFSEASHPRVADRDHRHPIVPERQKLAYPLKNHVKKIVSAGLPLWEDE